MPALPPQR